MNPRLAEVMRRARETATKARGDEEARQGRLTALAETAVEESDGRLREMRRASRVAALARGGEARARKMGAVPPDGWTSEDRAEIEALYAEAIRLEELTGVAHDVDHITPLSRGGLHLAANMRVTTARANRSKGAKTESPGPDRGEPEAERPHR